MVPLPLEYIRNGGSGTDFQASPHDHRIALAANADAPVGRPLLHTLIEKLICNIFAFLDKFLAPHQQ